MDLTVYMMFADGIVSSDPLSLLVAGLLLVSNLLSGPLVELWSVFTMSFQLYVISCCIYVAGLLQAG